MSAAKILFVVDAGPTVGGGHVMRSLSLAAALEAQGASCSFVTSPSVGHVLSAFAPEMAQVVAFSTEPRDLAKAADGEAFDGIVFDHYGLSERDHSAMAKGRPALAIDDLADRPLGAELVLDSGPARKAEDYAGLLPDEAELLLGPSFAPVRPEFAGLRDAALAWRGEPVGRVLVALGLSDLGGITGRVVERLRPRIGDVGLDIVLGADSPSLPGLSKVARRDPRMAVHVDTPHMARLTAEADLAIGAAGSSVWERCVLGLPSAIVVLADNQRQAAQALAERGAALTIDAAASDFDTALDRALMRLLTDADLRRDLARKSSEICDGLGAPRVAEAFLKLVAARAAA
jgi:UDP-2,4-diacetamido-2,4,6-trideoxy-beta-L-altropyranose hydrolase